MTVTGMEAGGWKLEYSTNGGGAWTEMIGSTFTLSAGTYATGSIHGPSNGRGRQRRCAGKQSGSDYR
jgi:hypothetical protein